MQQNKPGYHQFAHVISYLLHETFKPEMQNFAPLAFNIFHRLAIPR